MTGRERIKAAMHFQVPDMSPLEYHYNDTPAYEYGADKINDLFGRVPGDFGPVPHILQPQIPASDYNEKGEYHAFRRDEWGTLWQYRIYGISGMELEQPLEDLDLLDTYKFPPHPAWVEDEKEHQLYTKKVQEHQKEYYFTAGIRGFFEKMIMLRPFEDVLVDMITEDERMIRLLDRLEAYYARQIQAHIRAGVDCLVIKDDYGTQRDLIFSRDLFLKYFYPRYVRLFGPARAAGMDIHFHCCGKVGLLFEDFKKMGVASVWPQLPVYDMNELAYTLKQIGLAIAIHTDRARTMIYGTPDEVREMVNKEFDAFRPDKGGSWFYVEADAGFPYENMKALIETIGSFRIKK